MMSSRLVKIAQVMLAMWLQQACSSDESAAGSGGLRLAIAGEVSFDEARIALNERSHPASYAGSVITMDGLDAGPAHVRVTLLRGGTVVGAGLTDTVVHADHVADITVPVTAGALTVEITRLDEQ